MGIRALRMTTLLVALATFAPVAGVAEGGPRAGSSPVQRQPPKATIKGGHDQKSAWLTAEYRELQLRKRSEKASPAITIELRAGTDLVTISVAPKNVVVWRGGRRVAVDSPTALQSLQQLLGSSPAIFGVRAMLSDLEPVSALDAPDMALLSTAAFVASLVGDVGAPLRLADRFMEKHRGIFRQVRGSSYCWGSYSSEVSSAWNDLQACMDDAEYRGFFRSAYERLACNAVWILRSESAWFQYLKCLSPLSAIPQ